MTKLTFAQLVDIEQIQRMLEAHYKITGVLSAILDTDEKILVAAGWQDICTRFHRVHPGACERCRESDAYIKAHLSDFVGEFLDYKCKNGLWDVALPIIITGEHVATFFTGQFFYDDDKPNMDFFRAQAREFGFDEESYLEALSRVPVFSREQIQNIMDFYRNLVQILVETGLKNLELAREVEERRKTEEALRTSEERYALAVQGSNDGIWDLDLVTGEAYHSSRWKRILGFEDDEIDDNFKEWESRLHPDDHQRVMETGKAYEEGRIPAFEVEYRLRHKDGSYRWVLTRGACLRDSQGRPYRMAGSLTDITSRKLFDEERRRNEALFKAVLETLPVGVWILEKNGMIALSNEAARKIWAGSHYVGIDQYDSYKAWWHNTGKRVEKGEWAGARAVTKGETCLGEIIDIECFDGSRKTIANSAVPLKNDKGEISAAVIVNEDITELKRSEKSLMESEKKFRALFEESKDAILVSDTLGRPIDVNQAGLELFGYTKEEYLALDRRDYTAIPKTGSGFGKRCSVTDL